jgi:hypothetical protein
MKIAAAVTILMALAEPGEALLGRFRSKKNAAEVVAKPYVPVKGPGPSLPPNTLDNKNLDFIFEKNQIWKAEKLSGDKDFFKKLGSIHTPEYMYIGEFLKEAGVRAPWHRFIDVVVLTGLVSCCLHRLCRCACP